MEIVSWNFLFYITVVITVYYCLNRHAQNIWLLLASIFFIYTWGWANLIPLFLIGSATYFIGKKLRNSHNNRWFLSGISIIIFVFVLFRISSSPLFNFSNQLSDSTSSSLIHQFIIPLGFSFYVLQALSYLIDVYKSKIDVETNLIDFFLYMLYFPKFLAGPIERPGHFLPQLKSARFVDNQKVSHGSTLILIGLFRKMVIAQVLLSILPPSYIHAPIVNTHPELGIFSLPFFTYIDPIPYANRLIGIIAFGIFLYNDFAGYTGIVRGISLLMGIDISHNFHTPFFATTLSDFWSRWHISLSSWLRDYIYFPMTRFLKKTSAGHFSAMPIIIPLLTTMLLSGIWHGLTIPLIVWGLLYGLIMIIEQIVFQKWPILRPQNKSIIVKVFSGLLTFIVVTFAWVPFTAASFGEILAFWKVLFKGSGWNSSYDFSFWILILIVASFLLDFFQSKYKDELFILRWPTSARAVIFAFLILFLILAFTWTSHYTSKVFIYQGF